MNSRRSDEYTTFSVRLPPDLAEMLKQAKHAGVEITLVIEQSLRRIGPEVIQEHLSGKAETNRWLEGMIKKLRP
jgi:hypothetical protein